MRGESNRVCRYPEFPVRTPSRNSPHPQTRTRSQVPGCTAPRLAAAVRAMSLKDAVSALRSLKAELEACRSSKAELEVAYRGVLNVRVIQFVAAARDRLCDYHCCSLHYSRSLLRQTCCFSSRLCKYACVDLQQRSTAEAVGGKYEANGRE